MHGLALIVLVSYLIGAIPFGFMIARRFGGIDIRKYGSGNIGATNVGRILGWHFFAVVFVLDFAKGALPALAAMFLAHHHPELFDNAVRLADVPVFAGVAAILGHVFPVYLGFRGGKAVATGAGAVAVLLPIELLIAVGVWLLVLLLTRYVALGSIAAAAALAIARIILSWPTPFDEANRTLTAFAIFGAVLVIVRHRSNIIGLLRGTEDKVTDEVPPEEKLPPKSNLPS